MYDTWLGLKPIYTRGHAHAVHYKPAFYDHSSAMEGGGVSRRNLQPCYFSSVSFRFRRFRFPRTIKSWQSKVELSRRWKRNRQKGRRTENGQEECRRVGWNKGWNGGKMGTGRKFCGENVELWLKGGKRDVYETG